MNKTYSPSRINTFDNCKLQYKYKYINGLKSDLKTIESFRGSTVHEALEEFYKLIKGGHIESLEWILDEYKEIWEKNYTDSIKIIKKELTPDDYFIKGRQALVDYYNKYKPFDQAKVVDTEHFLSFNVESNGTKCSFCGILDRLDWNDKEAIFEIHDYKVTNSLMTQDKADNDWQLGLYHIALKEKWPDVEKIKLIWHSLLFNKEITSFRTKNQIKKLQENVVNKVKEIESCNDFCPNKSGLCDWCDFQNICPLWKHPKEMEELDINEYEEDSGVKLVAEYKKLEEAKNEFKEEIHAIEEKQEKIKQAVLEFAEKENISLIDGSDAQLKITVKEELKAPVRSENQKKWEDLRDFLKKEGRYEEISTVSNTMVNHKIKEWPQDFIDKLGKFLIKKKTKIIKLVKK